MGVTSVIAHIKIGQMHAALESKVLVVSAQGQSDKAVGVAELRGRGLFSEGKAGGLTVGPQTVQTGVDRNGQQPPPPLLVDVGSCFKINLTS